jgi:hypothetical protein
MKIFISHASEQHDLADLLTIALRGQGHKVFLDRDDLPPGNSYDDRISHAVEQCNLFIFLISPQSVEANSYALTELKFARKRWPIPNDRILPVLAESTAIESVPPYLRHLTLLHPEGNIIAEVRAMVDIIRKNRTKKRYYIYQEEF